MPSSTISPALDFALGRRLTEIALGLDAFERTTRGDGAADAEDLVRQALDRLEGEIAALDAGARKTFLTGMTRALRAAVRLFAGEPLTFAEKLTDLVGVPAEPVPDETIAALHDRLDGLMAARGFIRGTLADRVTAWQDGRYLDIDWVEDADDAAQIEVRRLQTATGTNAAWHLHMSGWTRERSIAYLRDVGFGQESWASVRTGMAQHPFRAPFLASYWFGNETVRALRENPAVDRAALVTALFRQVHSVSSLPLAVA